MVDYETLDFKPNAVVVSCGMLVFDPNGYKNEIFDALGVIIAPFASHMIMHTEEDQPGRTKSKSTMDWWAKLPSEVRNRVFGNNVQRISVAEHLVILRDMIKTHKIDEVYANSPRFDLAIAESLWDTLFPNEKFPISFRIERDVRSLEKFIFQSSSGRYGGGIFEFGNAHAEIDDCVRQAMVIQAAHQFRNVAIEILGDPMEFAKANYLK